MAPRSLKDDADPALGNEVGHVEEGALGGDLQGPRLHDQAVEVMAEEGFFINIDLPGPGPHAGDGLEWVMVEKLVSEGSGHSAEEYVLMTVRPVPDPHKNAAEIAHFYKDISTSTFIIRRDGMVVSAGTHGRNETPNNDEVDLYDKVRNTAIALMARVGLSGTQWQKLVNGLIEYKETGND